MWFVGFRVYLKARQLDRYMIDAQIEHICLLDYFGRFLTENCYCKLKMMQILVWAHVKKSRSGF
jgi:hypothetical protein